MLKFHEGFVENGRQPSITQVGSCHVRVNTPCIGRNYEKLRENIIV